MPFLKKHTTTAKKAIAVTLTHLLIVQLSYWLVHISFKLFAWPNNQNLLAYDAYWYYTIKTSGYVYAPGEGDNQAFFPLFPLVWRLINLSPLYVSLFNSIVFCISFIILTIKEKLNSRILLFILSFPSAIFFLLPYSESLFYIFCVLIILGYQRKNNHLLFIGLFGASLTRSVCVIFIPAIIISMLLTAGFSAEKIKKTIFFSLFQILATLGGFFTASAYIALNTGKWFYFFEVQKYWGRHWLIPSFPLSTISPERILGLDAIAFVIGIIAIYLCIKWGTIYLRQLIYSETAKADQPELHILFSALFLSGCAIIDTCFTYNLNEATNIWSINRHIMCTPFAAILIIYLYNQFEPKFKEKIFFVVVILGGIFFTGVYKYPHLALLYVFFFAIFLILKYVRSLNNIFWLYYIYAIFIQLGLYSDFLTNLWVG